VINIDARPRVLSRSDAGFDEVVQYVIEATEKVGLNADFKVEGDEVVVSAKP